MPPYKGPKRGKHHCSLSTAILIGIILIALIVLSKLTLRRLHHAQTLALSAERTSALSAAHSSLIDPVVQANKVLDARKSLGRESKAQLDSSSSETLSAVESSNKCHVDDHNEYHGSVIAWGSQNPQPSAAACCESCSKSIGCNIWVWCGRAEGCGYGDSAPAFQECWLKKSSIDYIMENRGKGNPGIHWTAGALYTEKDEEEWKLRYEEKKKAEIERLAALRNNPELPLVYLDITLRGQPMGRVEAVLFVKDAPRAAENMRVLCSGELGVDASGKAKTLAGSNFYRIIDRFIDQTGASVDGIYGGSFHDDPGGLKLKHDRKGLLSMANGGPDTNGGHFSILIGPAPHLNGNYVIFGEVVSGFEICEEVNKLSQGQKNNEKLGSHEAVITQVGQIRKGTYVDTPEYQAVLEAERARIAYRKHMDITDIIRLERLKKNESLPMVFFDVAIKGKYMGRIEMVLFAFESPLATENFRALCTGEAGVAPPNHEGAGKAYHFKGAYFYRIIYNFIDQTGVPTDSIYHGLFADDPAGLEFKHNRLGLLSMANIGPNTNGAHFSIVIAPAHHLDGHYTIFGEIIDGHHIALAINALAKAKGDHLNTQDAQIIDSGQVRHGKYLESEEFISKIEAEKKRVAATWKAPGSGSS